MISRAYRRATPRTRASRSSLTGGGGRGGAGGWGSRCPALPTPPRAAAAAFPDACGGGLGSTAGRLDSTRTTGNVAFAQVSEPTLRSRRGGLRRADSTAMSPAVEREARGRRCGVRQLLLWRRRSPECRSAPGASPRSSHGFRHGSWSCRGGRRRQEICWPVRALDEGSICRLLHSSEEGDLQAFRLGCAVVHDGGVLCAGRAGCLCVSCLCGQLRGPIAGPWGRGINGGGEERRGFPPRPGSQKAEVAFAFGDGFQAAGVISRTRSLGRRSSSRADELLACAGAWLEGVVRGGTLEVISALGEQQSAICPAWPVHEAVAGATLACSRRCRSWGCSPDPRAIPRSGRGCACRFTSNCARRRATPLLARGRSRPRRCASLR